MQKYLHDFYIQKIKKYLLIAVNYIMIKIERRHYDEKNERMSQLLTFDTSKRTFSSITLEHSSPSAIYPLKDKNLLFIEHTDYQFSPISFTITMQKLGNKFFVH